MHKPLGLTSVLAFGLERQNWMGKQEELAGALLVDIMAGGNTEEKKNREFMKQCSLVMRDG